ncbi:MAG: deoxyribodipyrimidine photo-lyase [Maricaulaceae bacterium]|nr:deoxyribodipyrimidine photo-lyase [Maricaulaceae bacterium]
MSTSAMPLSAPVIVWFRRDLRLADNPALSEAARAGRPLIAVYVLDDISPGRWRIGAAARWWLHHALESLRADLARFGVPLTLRRGNAAQIIPAVAAQTGAAAVFWNRRYEPWAAQRDAAIKTALKAAGVEARSFNAALLNEPWEVLTGAGEPYRVFTPYWRVARARMAADRPLLAPSRLAAAPETPASDWLEDWALTPKAPDWAAGFGEFWTPGEAGAQARLQAFVNGDLPHYAQGRDHPGLNVTSRLSPHLAFGEIGPRQAFAAAAAAAQVNGADPEKFFSELGWREFSYALLHHFPDLPEKNFQPKFDRFPWREDEAAFRAWTKGRTGYAFVDAGMRQLWATGWMHNRARMVAASFLTKHLLIDWRRGQDWFWDTLVDADLANNAASWQWVAGSGADAAPYFRIFNPAAQAQKYDSNAAYIRRWAPDACAPIIDHAAARTRALAAYQETRGER